MNEVRQAMARAVAYFSDQLLGIRSGVISPGVVDTVRVEHEGNTVPIAQVAVTFADQGRVFVQPHDPQMLGAVDRALRRAGFNSYVFSRSQVVVSFSPLSGAERARVIAHVGRLAEEAKVAVRNVRKRARQKLGKEELKAADHQFQGLTDEAIQRIEELKESKLAAL
jgi:ribosome recycling factor